MSIIKSIKQVLGLGPAAENHFWDGSVPNQLSLKRGTPDAPGTELMKFLEGVVSFPNQGQLLTANGYVKLPGGLIIQWGQASVPLGNVSSGQVNFPFPIPFPNAVFQTIATERTANQNVADLRNAYVANISLSQANITVHTEGTVNASYIFSWIAIGH